MPYIDIANECEGYVARSDIESLVRDHAMFEVLRGQGNVTLRVVDDEHARHMRICALLTAADLAERVDIRAQGQVAAVLASLR